MRSWLRGKPGGLAVFLVIAGLVTGGLGWVTAAALRLEREQRTQQAEAERANRLAVALWRLDSFAAPVLAREDSRPFDHYGPVHLTPLVASNNPINVSNFGQGAALEISPLLAAPLDGWTPLHFQVDQHGWKSPQVLDAAVCRKLERADGHTPLTNVTAERRRLLQELSAAIPAAEILSAARRSTRPDESRGATLFLAQNRNDNKPQQAEPPELSNGIGAQPPAYQNSPSQNNDVLQREFDIRRRSRLMEQAQQQQTKNAAERRPRPLALNSLEGNSWQLLDSKINLATSTEVVVRTTPLVPVWVTGNDGVDRLLALRMVSVEDREVCQGVLVDVERLRSTLADRGLWDTFSGAALRPARNADEPAALTALPLVLDPGPLAVANEPGWTPLHFGLALAWAAAIVALLAVGVGGWSLINLSQRRIRFVSAVTHELRTPLTTLRLYLDMLLGGLVRSAQQQKEYLETLNTETDRLTRLVSNVLDFSRLENQRPRLNRAPIEIATLIDRLRATWDGRCRDAGKELVVENTLADGTTLNTDAELLQQVVANLIDNACKYSRGAEDARVRLVVRAEKGQIVLELSDGGPGISARERGAIFRAFRRGRTADTTAGGVGLGLALALRWTRLLGGTLRLGATPAGGGACFQVVLPS